MRSLLLGSLVSSIAFFQSLKAVDAVTYPQQRFTEWDSSFPSSEAEQAEILDYTETLWNHPGTAPIESLSYEVIADESVAQADAIESLGMDEEIWDCFVNHYNDYTWNELGQESGVQEAFETLGWSSVSWVGDAPEPISESLRWGELSSAERAGMETICFFEDLWNEVPLGEWGTGRSQISDTDPPSYPEQRFTVWNSSFQSSDEENAKILGYTAALWNQPGTAPIESLSYETIADESVAQANAIISLGMNEEIWDCHVNHYDDYFWDEIGRVNGVQEAFETLGWSRMSWEGDAPTPVSESLGWDELSNAEREAMETICFFKELWDKEPLGEWGIGRTESPIASSPTSPEPTRAPDSRRPTPSPQTEQPAPSPTSRPTRAPTSRMPTPAPTAGQTPAPDSRKPTQAPDSRRPTQAPDSRRPTPAPTPQPTRAPVSPAPTRAPTNRPTSDLNSLSPTPKPSRRPTKAPQSPSPTAAPHEKPTPNPLSPAPTRFPTNQPTRRPTQTADDKLNAATLGPTRIPVSLPIVQQAPTGVPTPRNIFVQTTQEPADAPIVQPVTPFPTALRSRQPSASTAYIGHTRTPVSQEERPMSQNPVSVAPLSPSPPTTLDVAREQTMQPTSQLSIPVPFFRYFNWMNLSTATRVYAISLGYTRETWNVPGTAEIERLSFDSIEDLDDGRLAYVKELGFSKASWDCYVNHYRDFEWTQLENLGVQEYYVTLGWTESLWSEDKLRLIGNFEWSILKREERIAAESLCYLEPIWNQESLQNEAAWRAPVSISVATSSVAQPRRCTVFISALSLLLLRSL